MGVVVSRLVSKPIRRFNVANRAEAVISKDKPKPAPDYASTEKQRELAKSVNPNFLEEHYKKDPALDERLKSVFVESHIEKPIEAAEIESTKLKPQSRDPAPEFEFGFYEPTSVSKGKCTLKQAIQFMAEHHRDPATNTAGAIAVKYNLDEKVVENVLEYFGTMQFHKTMQRVEKKSIK